MRSETLVAEFELARARRILVSRLRFLGDLILVTPLLRAMRELAPRATIGFLAEDRYGGILCGHEDVDSLFLLRTHGAPAALGGLTWAALVRNLRRERFELVLDLFANPRSAILARLCGAPLRVGGDHGLRGKLFTHHPLFAAEDRTAVDHHLAHLRGLGVGAFPRYRPRLLPTEEETRRAAGRLRELVGDVEGPMVGVHPGASWPPKRWPLEHFAAVLEELRDRWGANLLITHGPGEEGLGAWLSQRLKGRCAVLPPLGWRELAGVLSLCDVYLSNDCGPMHVSAAAGTPTVGVFGPSDPRIWFPYPREEGHRAVEADLPCRPCPGRECLEPVCMREVSPAVVLSALEEAWRVSGGGVRRAALPASRAGRGRR